MIQSKSVSVVEEKRIIIGLITSSNFIQQILPIFQLDYFVNSYLRTIASWCVSFYEEHERAPYKHIQDIYEAEALSLKESDGELIQDLLKLLTEQYDPESANVGYLKDCTINYFRRRELEIVVNNVSILKEKGEYDEAEAQITRFSNVTTKLDSGALINIGNLEEITEIYRQREEEDKKFFHMPGDLGRYLGNFKRGDVVGYYAPAKRGKSWTLVDHFKQGVLQRKKTLFWSIEMTKTEILPRIMKSFRPMVDEEGEYPYPVFDCIHNQTGDCADRVSNVIILDEGVVLNDPSHKACTICMRHNHPHEFAMTVHFARKFREADDIFTVRKMMESKRMKNPLLSKFNKFGRLSVHPKYTLTYDKMMRDIEILNNKDGFIPDIMILDYIDILGIDTGFDNYKAVDEAWKLLAKIAGEFNVLMITATQANKEGHSAEVLNATHQGGYYGKNQHVNVMCGLNQTSEEKEVGIIKYGITEARSQYFIPGKTCIVLQDVKAGQSYLDSYYDWNS